MLTRVSRKRIRYILPQRFPHLLNLCDLNSGHVTRSYIRTPDGLLQYTEQEEVLAQGCPSIYGNCKRKQWTPKPGTALDKLIVQA